MAAAVRHEFYESDERVVISIFDKGADPELVKVHFAPRKLSYTNGERNLILEPLKGQIDPQASDYTVGKVKVEVRLVKCVPGRWAALVGDSPDPLAPFNRPTEATRAKHKNWEGISDNILSSDKDKTAEEDPNVGGDATLNTFFQKIYADADDDTKKAMLKSYSESGGTTLSTNWDEVKRAPVEVKPPAGSEWKKWS